MVNQPVLSHEWDFSLGAERGHDEGAGREEWSTPQSFPELLPLTRWGSSPTAVPPAQRSGGSTSMLAEGCLGRAEGRGESSFERKRNGACWG